MEFYGITLDFDDRKSCSIQDDMCSEWDGRFEELSENEKLNAYWDNNLNKILSQTKNIIAGTIGDKCIVYSADKEAINIIQNAFKELNLDKKTYEDLTKCESCLNYDYIKSSNKN